jgi:carbamoyltransferase
MIILGTKPAQHDACFALVRDGEPLFIYEQERFNRVKHGMSSHLSVLFDALAEHSISPRQIDLVTNCINPALLGERKQQVRRFLDGPAVGEMDAYLDWRLPTWRQVLLAAGFPAERVIDVRHHVCHCAGVYYSSPFNDAAILSLDGSGETETAMMAHGSGRDIKILRTTDHPQSIGLFYQAATYWLGWGFGEEGKTMALAAYGDPNRFRKRVETFVEVDGDGNFRFVPLESTRDCRFTSEELVKYFFSRYFGPARPPEEPLSRLHMDVAAGVQAVCEKVMMNSARFLRRETGAEHLLLTGGVGLNSVSNGLIMRAGLFDRVVAYPQANDTGTALGGALYAYHQFVPASERRSWHMVHGYWGKRIDTDNVELAARKYGLQGVRTINVHETAADLLAAGNIVGWVQGRSEIGPRALGNRSILGNPTVPGVKDMINAGIKHREHWRPFAPSVLREDLAEYFEADQDLPYMTIVAPIREKWRGPLESVGHVDGTARVQTVTEESNPLFHALLTAFKRRTGLGVLLNTSFNDRGEPLVQTCDQALRLYAASAMDAVCIGDHVFTEKTATAKPAPFAAYFHNFDKLPDTRLLLLRSEGRMTAAMLQHLLRVRPCLKIAADACHALDVLPGPERSRPHIVRRLSANLQADYDAVVCYVNRPADRFIFDRDLYYSEVAELSRHVMDTACMPVYWIDATGDVTPARDVLYVHHEQVKCSLPSSYERYWIDGC